MASHWARVAAALRIEADELLDEVLRLCAVLPAAFGDAAAALPASIDRQAVARIVDPIVEWVGSREQVLLQRPSE